jgi:hypothetical protein
VISVNELRRRASELEPVPGNPPRFTWEFKRNSLRETMLSSNPELFMTWPVVEESLHSGVIPQYTHELSEIVEHMPQQRWLNCVHVPQFGGNSRDGNGATGTSIQQAYYLWTLLNETGFNASTANKICEIGGGYGAMALVLWRLGFTGEHTIKDVPEMLLLQEYYLSAIGIGPELHINFEEYDKPTADKQDLTIAMFSISETPIDVRGRIEIPESDYYMIGYQDAEWVGVTNRDYFERFAESRPHIDWTDIKREHNGTHRFLIGSKAGTK